MHVKTPVLALRNVGPTLNGPKPRSWTSETFESRVCLTVRFSPGWELRDNMTVYDAAYVALAENLDAGLLHG
ncbi:MAG: hypothetical protein QOJ29_2995 [Thermoleophilaceae bacterium]|nr:hypothetical protein [Thermoleophilaceae bacterium]